VVTSSGDNVENARVSERWPRLCGTFRCLTRFARVDVQIVVESVRDRAEKQRANGRTMMMNGPVQIGGGDVGRARGIDVSERLVELHRKLKRIAKARALLDLHEADALREAQKLQLWKQFGHASLVDYMVQELGYTSWRTAEDRLRLANALPDLPRITEAIQCGQINMSQARELARVATPETEHKWIERAQEMNVRQVEQAVAGHSKGDLPDDPVNPRLVRQTLYLSVRPETEVMFREARKALEKERGEKLDDDAVLEALCRGALRPSGDVSSPSATHVGDEETVQAPGSAAIAATDAEVCGMSEGEGEGSVVAATVTHVGGAPYRVAVTVCKECKRGWQHGAGAVVEMSPAAVERAQCDAQWIGDLESEAVERARQEISPATRRKVLHRDQGRCRAPGCQCHSNLDVHHVIHREHGGTNELDNLLTLCEAHHLAHHDGTLAIVRVDGEVTFRFEGRNKFTRRTREVATREALRKHGFDREQVRVIMSKTVNEIGEASLSAEQWLAIALRHAGKNN
jgi:5-methylcytosine-specific restriction endonuclease McrA